MKAFEYMTKVAPTDAELNALGMKGWEMVAIDAEFNAYFKREKA